MNSDKTYCFNSENECALVKECARHWTNNITGTDRLTYRPVYTLMRTAQFKCRGPRDARCPWFEKKENGKMTFEQLENRNSKNEE